MMHPAAKVFAITAHLLIIGFALFYSLQDVQAGNATAKPVQTTRAKANTDTSIGLPFTGRNQDRLLKQDLSEARGAGGPTIELAS